MRKCFLIGLILIVGCASASIVSDAPSEYFIRLSPILQKVEKCYGSNPYKAIIMMDYPQAYVDDAGTIYFTTGMFVFDDDAIALILAHEIAHDQLGHISSVRSVSYATTGAMMIVNFIIPGAGALNHAVNPAVTRNYSKSKELEADTKAVEICEKCLGMPREKIVSVFHSMKNKTGTGGGFWSTHPSWEDRIANIKTLPH